MNNTRKIFTTLTIFLLIVPMHWSFFLNDENSNLIHATPSKRTEDHLENFCKNFACTSTAVKNKECLKERRLNTIYIYTKCLNTIYIIKIDKYCLNINEIFTNHEK